MNFTVNFPVSREYGPENGSLETPSTAISHGMMQCCGGRSGNTTAGIGMVRPRRFELLAYSFGGCRSIQLSYGRTFFINMLQEQASPQSPQ